VIRCLLFVELAALGSCARMARRPFVLTETLLCDGFLNGSAEFGVTGWAARRIASKCARSRSDRRVTYRSRWWRAAAQARVQRVAVALSVRGPVRPAWQRQRQGQGRRPCWLRPYVRSYTKPGESVVFVYLKDSTRASDVPELWYQVRKKVGDIKQTLPQGVQHRFGTMPKSTPILNWRLGADPSARRQHRQFRC